MTRAGGKRSTRERLGAAGSVAVFASMRPPPKPIARMKKVVPTPAKKMRALDAIVRLLIIAGRTHQSGLTFPAARTGDEIFRIEHLEFRRLGTIAKFSRFPELARAGFRARNEGNEKTSWRETEVIECAKRHVAPGCHSNLCRLDRHSIAEGGFWLAGAKARSVESAADDAARDG
jgi:hypothetical protein